MPPQPHGKADVQVRPAQPGDGHTIATIRSAGWRQGYRGMLPDEVLARIQPEPQRWEDLLSEPQPGVRHSIAEIEDLPVGWLCFGPSRDADTTPGTGEIYACYVHPEHWCHGVGRTLVATALREPDNAAPVILWVLTGQPCGPPVLRDHGLRSGWRAARARPPDRGAGGTLSPSSGKTSGMSEPLFGATPVTVAPGAVHVPGWLDVTAQRDLVERCREWARGPGGMRQHRTPRGGTMSVRMIALGWHWEPYRYSREVPGAGPVAPFPRHLGDLARAGVRDAYGGDPPGESADYDVALINFYDADAKMGMHQDREELADVPVVSLSLGDTCVFRFGNTETRGRPYTDVELRSGDLFVFGRPARRAYHGVPRTRPGSADPACGLTSGRLNITIRATGMD